MVSEFEELFGEWGNDSEGVPLPLTVRTYIGDGGDGPKYSEPRSHPGLVQIPQTKLVRTPNGDEAVSSTLVYAPLELAGHFTLGSRVTPADGREVAILTVGKPDVYGLFGFMVLNLE